MQKFLKFLRKLTILKIRTKSYYTYKNNMGKKILIGTKIGILVAIAIVGVILVSGCSEKYLTTTDMEENKPNVIVTVTNTSTKKYTSANCDNMSLYFERDKCYLNLHNKNFSICEKIKDSSIKNICYGSVAESEKNFSICEKMINCSKFEREICYYGVASAKKDISICDHKIVDKNLKDRCYLSIAISENDSSICDKINDESEKSKCYSKTLVAQP